MGRPPLSPWELPLSVLTPSSPPDPRPGLFLSLPRPYSVLLLPDPGRGVESSSCTSLSVPFRLPVGTRRSGVDLSPKYGKFRTRDVQCPSRSFVHRPLEGRTPGPYQNFPRHSRGDSTCDHDPLCPRCRRGLGVHPGPRSRRRGPLAGTGWCGGGRRLWR